MRQRFAVFLVFVLLLLATNLNKDRVFKVNYQLSKILKCERIYKLGITVTSNFQAQTAFKQATKISVLKNLTAKQIAYMN